MKAWFAHYTKRGQEVQFALDADAYSKLCVIAGKTNGEQPQFQVEFHADSVALKPVRSGRTLNRREEKGQVWYTMGITTDRAAKFPECGRSPAEVRFEIDRVHIMVPLDPKAPMYREKSYTRAPKREPQRRSSTMLLDIEGRTLEFELPLGEAVDLALQLGQYRKKRDQG